MSTSESKANLPGGPPRSHDLPEEEVEDVAIQLMKEADGQQSGDKPYSQTHTIDTQNQNPKPHSTQQDAIASVLAETSSTGTTPPPPNRTSPTSPTSGSGGSGNSFNNLILGKDEVALKKADITANGGEKGDGKEEGRIEAAIKEMKGELGGIDRIGEEGITD